METVEPIITAPDGAEYSLEQNECSGAYEFTLKVVSERELSLSGLSISFSIKSGDIAGRWYPHYTDRGMGVTWRSPYQSSFNSGAPVVAFYAPDDRNRLTAALSDGTNEWSFRTGANEVTGRLEFRATLGSLIAKSYSVKFLVDLSPRPYYDSIKAVADWWGEVVGSPYIPKSAYDPVYSTWYVFHHDVYDELLIKHSEMAARLGFRTLFIDAGWSVPDDSPGATHAGDWKPYPEKFPDMKSFVERIHSLGMKVVLWAAPGIAGYKSRAAKRYEGMTLGRIDGINAFSLDPRYPVIRANVCRDLCTLVRSTGIDGLKLDFIDCVNGSDCAIDEKRDFASVKDAMKCLLSDLTNKLRALDPEFLIEYRQSYTSPDILKSGNIVRSADCPQDQQSNRQNIIDLRLQTNSAVHADMVQFMPDEEAEISALQITNILFSVPQISVDLEKLSDRQTKMLGFYIGFMSEKRKLLTGSHIAPHRCEANFTCVEAENEAEKLAVLYAERLYTLTSPEKTQYIVNSAFRNGIIIGSEKPEEYEITLLDCTGEIVRKETRRLCGYERLDVPLCGMAIVISMR